MYFIFENQKDPARLDKFLASNMTDHSRNTIQKMIDSGIVSVNGKIIKERDFKLNAGDNVEIEQSFKEKYQKDHCNTLHINPAHHLSLNIVFEDEHLAIINKPPALTVHPGAGNSEDTLANALVAHYGKNLSHFSTSRPGILHRLDRDTSGLIIIAKNDTSHQKLALALKNREISRVYLAIVFGNFEKKKGKIETMICRDQVNRIRMKVSQDYGRQAITHYCVIDELPGISLVECRLETGRTHQIRVHMSWLGHPIIGDKVYKGAGGRGLRAITPVDLRNIIANVDRQLLHAYRISFFHPVSGELQDYRCFPAHDMLNLMWKFGEKMRKDLLIGY